MKHFADCLQKSARLSLGKQEVFAHHTNNDTRRLAYCGCSLIEIDATGREFITPIKMVLKALPGSPRQKKWLF